MPLTGPILADVRSALLIDGDVAEVHRLTKPVGMDSVFEARGHHWQVIGVVSDGTELRVLCVRRPTAR